MPELYVITGSNGAGKSTFALDYLPEHIAKHCQVFDGDKQFVQKIRELFPSLTRSHKEARNLAASWLEDHFRNLTREAIAGNRHFSYEGHFSSEGPWSTIDLFKEKGYSVHMIYLGVADTSLSEFRVVDRSKSGGHYVNPIEIDRNFHGNLFF